MHLEINFLALSGELLEILHTHVPEGHFYKSKNDLINSFEILRDVVKFFGKAPLLVPTKVTESEEADLDAYPRLFVFLLFLSPFILTPLETDQNTFFLQAITRSFSFKEKSSHSRNHGACGPW